MTDKNFIFSMKPYEVEVLCSQVAWMLEKRTETASRKMLPGLWKITDKLNAVPKVSEAEQKRRNVRRKIWGGLFLIMGIFLFVPGVMKPQELPGPLVAGFFAIVLGVLYLRKDGIVYHSKNTKTKKSFEKKAKQMLENLNGAMNGQKLRLVLEETGFVLSGMGEEKNIPYEMMECTLETADLFGLVYENRMVVVQKKELLLGTAEEFGKQIQEKTRYMLQE